MARIMAHNMRAALAFKDAETARQVLSSLDVSEDFTFGLVLDSQKKVFASYFRPAQTSEKEKLMARVKQATLSDKSEALITDRGYVVAIVPVEMKGQIIGYTAVGRKRV